MPGAHTHTCCPVWPPLYGGKGLDCWGQLEELGPLRPHWWECETGQLLGDQVTVPQRIKHRATTSPGNPSPGMYVPRR